MQGAWRTGVAPYAVAVASVAVATVVTLHVPALVRSRSSLLFLAAVIVAAWYGGLVPSLTAVLMSGVLYFYVVIPPVFSFRFSDSQDKVRLGAFVLVAVLISSLHESRRRAERVARSFAQRINFALESTHMGVWDLDLQTGALWHSPALEDIFGRAAPHFANTYEALLGYTLQEDRDILHRAVTNSMESGADFQVDHRIDLTDGAFRLVTTRGRVFMGPSGKPERLVAIVGVTASADEGVSRAGSNQRFDGAGVA